MNKQLVVFTNDTIELKSLIFEDFINYKRPSLFIGFPYCDFKCDKEAGGSVCQNSLLAHVPSRIVNLDAIIYQYINNPITSAIVLGGLEPFLSTNDMLKIVKGFRVNLVIDPIVIYTGYMPIELTENHEEVISQLISSKNIIIKYGRYIPNKPTINDPILGVTLASDNQFAALL